MNPLFTAAGSPIAVELVEAIIPAAIGESRNERRTDSALLGYKWGEGN